jgi:hypothetical protein
LLVREILLPTKTVHDPRWSKANASFLSFTTADDLVALKAWGIYIGTLVTPVPRDPAVGGLLGAFYTITGYAVLCTSEVHTHDELWVLCGSQRPLILRQREEGYTFICAAQTLKPLQGRGIMSQSVVETSGRQQITIY